MISDRRFQMYAYFSGVLVVAVLLWRLGPERPEFAEVTGVVTLDGKPIEALEVSFCPDPERGSRGPSSSRYTDEQGRYTMRCDKYQQDGAVLGIHRVVIFDITTYPSGGGAVGGELKALQDDVRQVKASQAKKPINPSKISRIPTMYGDVSGTPFTGIEVKSGSQEQNFELVSTKK